MCLVSLRVVCCCGSRDTVGGLRFVLCVVLGCFLLLFCLLYVVSFVVLLSIVSVLAVFHFLL